MSTYENKLQRQISDLEREIRWPADHYQNTHAQRDELRLLKGCLKYFQIHCEESGYCAGAAAEFENRKRAKAVQCRDDARENAFAKFRNAFEWELETGAGMCKYLSPPR